MSVPGDTPLLSVQGVTKRFGGLTAVSDVSFDIAAGEILGVAGPNGSGKSTLFDLITGIPFKPTSGEVHFDGSRIDTLSADKIAGLGLARTFQKDAEFVDLSGRDTLELAMHYGCHDRDKPDPEEILDLVELPMHDRDRPSAEVSVFGKKKLMIASAMALNPRLLMLDEPASGLTKPEIEDLGRLLRSINSRGTAILLIEHVLTLLLALSERLIVLNQGALLSEGKPDEVIADPHVIEAYLGGRRE